MITHAEFWYGVLSGFGLIILIGIILARGKKGFKRLNAAGDIMEKFHNARQKSIDKHLKKVNGKNKG